MDELLPFEGRQRHFSDEQRRRSWTGIADKLYQSPVFGLNTGRNWRRFAAAAAVLAPAMFVGQESFWQDNSATVHYHTAYGETKRIVLPDASVVVLNGNSELPITKPWLPN